MVNRVLIINYELVFKKEKPKKIEDYINGIDKAILLRLACFLSRNSMNFELKTTLSNWFQPGNQDFLDMVYKRIMDVGVNIPFRIIHPYASLSFFQTIYKHWNESNEFKTELESEIELFKAYLLLNQDYTDKDKTVLATTNEPYKCKLSAKIFSHSIIDNDIVNYDLNKSITTQFQKAYILFDELSKHDEFNELLIKFYEYNNTKDWKEYLRKVLPFLSILLKSEISGNIEIEVPKNENFEKDCEFIEKFSVSVNSELDTEIDFKEIRSNPLLKIEVGKYLIINDLFLSERIFKTLYFKLNSLNNTLNKPIKEFKSKYCDLYSEKRLLYNILNYTFDNRYVKYTGSYLKSNGISAEPDYYLRNRNKILIFESKDFLIPANIKTSGNFNLLKKSFKSKIYFDIDRKKRKIEPKAILQLIRCIERLIDNIDFVKVDKELIGKSLNIYPILVLHDNLYNSLGLNKLANYWFNSELSKLEKIGKNIKKVRPLVIIDIDTMIYIQESLKKSNFCYDRLIDSYIKEVINLEDKKAKTRKLESSQKQNSHISFMQFISNNSIIQDNFELPVHYEKFAKDVIK